LELARGRIWIRERQPADDAAHEIDLLAEIEAFLGLAADLMQDLHQHRPLNAAKRELRPQVLGGEIAREAVADGIGPSVGVPAGPPEVMMRVDHVLIHQEPAARGPGATKASWSSVSQTLPDASTFGTPI
jgi:hypothetical protein